MTGSTSPESTQERLLAGIQPVAAALKNNPAGIKLLTIATDTTNQRVNDLVLLARDAGIEIKQELREQLDQLSGFERHQDVIALLHSQTPPSEADLLPLLAKVAGDPLVLVLDGVQDPHNLGACLRSADASGVDAVIIPKDRSVKLNATVRKVAAGAAETVPLLEVTNIARCLKDLQSAGVWVYGTSGDAEALLYDFPFDSAVALVMGSEGDGLRRLTWEQCDHLMRLPMHGAVESLNVSVATGICLYEILRARMACSQD